MPGRAASQQAAHEGSLSRPDQDGDEGRERGIQHPDSVAGCKAGARVVSGMARAQTRQERGMTEMQGVKAAYAYPLLIKQLWHTPLAQAPDQVIVYRDKKRFTYRQ